jgi:hypothetical protein
MATKPRTKKAKWAKPAPKKLSDFDRVANRVIAAVDELNAALKEAAPLEEIQVQIRSDDEVPRNYYYKIYHLTHMSLGFQITRQEPLWQAVENTSEKLNMEMKARVFRKDKSGATP